MLRKNILLIIIFAIAFLLRVTYLPSQSLTFGYDQARDAFIAQEIVSGDLKILGPPASAPGMYHGVFYYYLLAPAYFIGHGSPLAAAYWISFLNAAAVFIIYALAIRITKNKNTSLLAALFFACSFEAAQYATWLSNPTIGVWTVPLIYLGLWDWINGNKKYAPILTGVALGLSIQAEIFLLYHLAPVLLWTYVERKKIRVNELVGFAIALVLSTSTMLAVEVKFGFKSIEAVKGLIFTQDSVVQMNKFSDFLLLYLNQMSTAFRNNIFPINIGYAAAMGFSALIFLLSSKDKNKKFLATFVLSHITVVSVGGVSTPFLMVGIGGAVVIMMAIFINEALSGNKSIRYLFLALVLISNLVFIQKDGKYGSVIFSIQKEMTLKKQLAAIDYTYSDSNNEKFSINTITSPLWINVVWSYLYNWYGLEKYGYTPSYHGKDQIGQLGNSLQRPSDEVKNFYLISEPLQGIPERYVIDANQEEAAKYQFINKNNFGQITVIKSIKKQNDKQ